MNGSIPPELTDHLTQAKQLAANRLLRPNYFANVAGVGIGKKVVGGDTTPTYSIRVYVVSKINLGALSPATTVPSSFLDLPTDIIEVGRLGRTARLSEAAKVNHAKDPDAAPPPRPGSPISVRTNAPNVNQGFRGTLAAVVQAGPGPGDPRYILSCNHVLAVNGRVRKDDDAAIVSAEFVGEQSTIAEPSYFKKLERDGSNSADCALGLLPPYTKVQAAFPDGFTLSPDGPADSKPDMQVTKFGASTGRTYGTIVDADADLYISYSFGTFRLVHQVVIDSGNDYTDFATLGDSGALVVDTGSRRAIAMIFAASGRFAVACPLTAAFKELETAAGLKPGSLSLVLQ